MDLGASVDAKRDGVFQVNWFDQQAKGINGGRMTSHRCVAAFKQNHFLFKTGNSALIKKLAESEHFCNLKQNCEA